MSAIPGNAKALEDLRKILASGEAIGFVGAGVSAGLYPTWTGLIRQLADRAVDRGATEAQRDEWMRQADRRPMQAARLIKRAAGDREYRAWIQEIFKYKTGPDGKTYTPLHSALMRLPFRGFVTTNYDPGLLEARREFRTTGRSSATWKDPDTVAAWHRNEIFRNDSCPILYAHGIHDRAETIVLDSDDYREAYNSASAYRRLFQKLWTQDRLVFVGFGFSDPWLDYIADEGLTPFSEAAGEARHIALVGIPPEEVAVQAEKRQIFREQYGAEPLFYLISKNADGRSDHSDLLRVLQEAAPDPR